MPSGTEGTDPRHGSTDHFRPRVGSMSSIGAFPTGSAMPSPASVTGGPLRVGTAAPSPFTNPSPSPMSPSSPPARRESSASARPPGLFQPRTLIESTSDPTGTSTVGHLRHREAPYARSGSSSSAIESRMSQGQEPPAGGRHSSGPTRPPALLHQTTSSSSGVSSNSQFSSFSSLPSSSYNMRSNEEEARPQLPPLEATGSRKSVTPTLADYSLRKSHTPELHTLPTGPQHHSHSSPFHPPPIPTGKPSTVLHSALLWLSTGPFAPQALSLSPSDFQSRFPDPHSD